MPSKVKANAISNGSAGFLKPTFSSLSKTVQGNEMKPSLVKDKVEKVKQTEKNKNGPKSIENGQNHENGQKRILVPVAENETSLHSSTSTTLTTHSASTSRASSTDRRSQPEQKTVTPTTNSLSSPVAVARPLLVDATVESNEKQIADARKICDDLREQIEDLKLQQKQFESRLSEDLNNNEFDKQEKQDKGPVLYTSLDMGDVDRWNELECQNCGSDPVKKSGDIGNGNIPVNSGNAEDLNLVKISEQNDPVPSEDSFTLHGSMTSSDAHDMSMREEWVGYKSLSKDVPPKKVIKRLFSEREHYKRKVRHLQVALHRLKKQTMSCMSRSPDIAAHDIVYFNADLIGEGDLSYVFSGMIYKDQTAAIKKLVRPDMMSTSDRSYLAAEAGLLMTLHHRNIVEVFGVSTAPLQPLIVTELVKGRNLHDRLHSADAWPLSPVEYYSVIRDITIGMAYLHGQKPPVLHLNLRPCNILLDANGCAKVADFGFSKIRMDARISNRSNLAYLAPELLHFPVHLTTKLDVFSFAMIMWEMTSMQKPYKDVSTSEIIDRVSNGKRLSIPNELPSGFHALLSRCWDQSPMQRPSFKELIILFETMTLPPAWDDAINRSTLNRADTKGLITPRDGRSSLTLQTDLNNVSRNDTEQKQQKTETSSRKERKRLSDEIALESDMITMGYTLPKPEHFRNGTSYYLEGFYPEVHQHHSHESPKATKNLTVHVGSPSNRRNLLRMSPLAASRHLTYRMTPNYPTGGGKPRHSLSGILESPAVRNLNHELWETPQPLERSSRENHGSFADSGDGHSNKRNGHARRNFRTSEHNVKATISQGSRTSSESADSHDAGMKAPEPLTDRDFRFVDQDLVVGTPEVVTGRSMRSGSKPRPTGPISSPRKSQEELRTAVSIPYLKNLRSGDEATTSTGSQSQRSHFDEKLNSYMTEACEAESRNDINARYQGWHSARSNILNRPRTVSSSEQVKVHSIGTSAADRVFDHGRKHKNGSVPTAWSESTESLMTAIYKPTEAQRKQLKGRIQRSKSSEQNQDEFNSSTTSDNSFDESRRIGVLSIPSTTGVNPTSFKHRHSNSDPKTHHGSLDKSEQYGSKGQWSSKNPVQRSKSWNKLKNSYSPEPLMPIPSDMNGPSHGTPPHSRTHVTLPPNLNSLERQSAFSRPVPVQYKNRHGSSPSKSKRKVDSYKRNKNDSRYRENSRDTKDRFGHEAERNMRHPVDASTASSDPVDEVGATLRQTAAELTAVSEVLETAADVRKRDARETKTREKREKGKSAFVVH